MNTYLTKEQRKDRYIYRGGYFTFTSCVDLSEGVDITLNEGCVIDERSDKEKMLLITRDSTNFITDFLLTIHPHLNGFSGVDSIRYRFNF